VQIAGCEAPHYAVVDSDTGNTVDDLAHGRFASAIDVYNFLTIHLPDRLALSTHQSRMFGLRGGKERPIEKCKHNRSPAPNKTAEFHRENP
jgi:hypothetical protein